MNSSPTPQNLVTIDVERPVWNHFFTVSPLVVIGTREENGEYDLAPKHLAFPIGWQNYFGFVCTPRHRTYQNIERERQFTVSYPKPTQVVLASLTASPRCDNDAKPAVHQVSTFPAEKVNAVFLAESYLFLECQLHSIIGGFGENSLIAGKIVAAYVEENAYRNRDRDDSDLIYQSPLMVYLQEGRFATVDKSYSFPFPKDFRR